MDQGRGSADSAAQCSEIAAVLSLFCQHHACRLRPIGVCFGNSLAGWLPGTCDVIGRAGLGRAGTGQSEALQARAGGGRTTNMPRRLTPPLTTAHFADRPGCSRQRHASPLSNLHRQPSKGPTPLASSLQCRCTLLRAAAAPSEYPFQPSPSGKPSSWIEHRHRHLTDTQSPICFPLSFHYIWPSTPSHPSASLQKCCHPHCPSFVSKL
jgi:hypothetical protein